MVKNKEELLNSLKAVIGDSDDDNTISLLEDVSDTLDELEVKSSDKENWKQKYEDNDKAWRTKYRERFYSSNERDDNGDNEEEEEKLTYESLFRKEGN